MDETKSPVCVAEKSFQPGKQHYVLRTSLQLRALALQGCAQRPLFEELIYLGRGDQQPMRVIVQLLEITVISSFVTSDGGQVMVRFAVQRELVTRTHWANNL